MAKDIPVLSGVPRGFTPIVKQGPKQLDGTPTTTYTPPPARKRPTMLDTSGTNAVGPLPKRFGNRVQKPVD